MEQIKQQILQEFEEKIVPIEEKAWGFKTLREAREWLEENDDKHLFYNETYPESILELSPEKIKVFLSSAITTAYEKGVQDGIEKVKQTREDLKELYVKNDDLSLTK